MNIKQVEYLNHEYLAAANIVNPVDIVKQNIINEYSDNSDLCAFPSDLIGESFSIANLDPNDSTVKFLFSDPFFKEKLFCIYLWNFSKKVYCINERYQNFTETIIFDWKEKINPEFFLNFPDLCVYVKTEKTFFSDDISVRGYYVYFEFLDKYYSLNIGLDIFNDIYVVKLPLIDNFSYEESLRFFIKSPYCYVLSGKLSIFITDWNFERLSHFCYRLLGTVLIQISSIINSREPLKNNLLSQKISLVKNIKNEQISIVDNLDKIENIPRFLDIRHAVNNPFRSDKKFVFEEREKLVWEDKHSGSDIIGIARDCIDFFSFYLCKNYSAFRDRLPHFITNTLNKFNNCLVNYESILYLLRNYIYLYNSIKFGTDNPCYNNELSSYEIDDYICYQLWYLSKGIYKFEPELLKCIPKLDVDELIPDKILVNIPEWCIYVELNDIEFGGLKPLGYFVYIDAHKEDGYILNIILHFESENISVPVPLIHGKSYRTVIQDDSRFMNYPYQNFSQYYEKIKKLTSVNETRYKMMVRQLKPNVDILEFNLDVVRNLVPQILYLCADNKEIVNITKPDQLIRKSPWIRNDEHGFDLIVNPDVSIIKVGASFADDTINVTDTTEISFSFHDNQIEIVHPNVCSLKEVYSKQLAQNQLISRLKNFCIKLNQNYEETQQIVRELEEENHRILEDQQVYIKASDESYNESRLKIDNYLKQIDELNCELYKLKSVLSLEYKQRTMLRNSADSHIRKSLDILERIAHKMYYTPSQCLEIIENYSFGKLEVLQSAWESAKEIDDYFQNGHKLLNLLARLVYDYLPNYLQFGDTQGKNVFTDSEYAAQESSSVLNSKVLSEQRKFFYDGDFYVMKQHLKIGVSKDKKYTMRVHFMVDKERKKIVIGYCGKHLDLSNVS